jgi:hypothetical protein
LEFEFVTVFMVVSALHDLKHPSEKTAFHVLLLDNRTDASRGQLANAFAPMYFGAVAEFTVWAGCIGQCYTAEIILRGESICRRRERCALRDELGHRFRSPNAGTR